MMHVLCTILTLFLFSCLLFATWSQVSTNSETSPPSSVLALNVELVVKNVERKLSHLYVELNQR